MLVEHFMKKFSKQMGRTVRLNSNVMEKLATYDFPGNVREIENMVEQGIALTLDGEEIQLDDLLPDHTRGDIPKYLDDIVAVAERQAIRSALIHAESTDSAAEHLGLSPTTLWRKMKKLKIENPHGRH